MGLAPFIKSCGSTCLNLPPLWVMCVVSGENKENGVRGTDYGESSPCCRSRILWFDYMEPFERFS